jgi:katanin p60 ATPase-containing subunit A1
VDQFEIADNMDLPLILSEFEAYYEMKFDKKPKLVRKLANGEERIPRPRQPEGKSLDVDKSHLVRR